MKKESKNGNVSDILKKNETSGLVEIVNLTGEIVLIPEERLTRKFAAQQLETRYDKERVFAMAGVLIYPCNSDNKNYVHIAWRGTVVVDRRIITLGFYDVISGTVIDVPCTFCFVPFSDLSSNIGGTRFVSDRNGTICMMKCKND